VSPGPEKTKQNKTNRNTQEMSLLSLSPCHLSLPLLPIFFDMAGYVGGLDVGGVVSFVIQSSAMDAFHETGKSYSTLSPT
jgi:hypothetical protein